VKFGIVQLIEVGLESAVSRTYVCSISLLAGSRQSAASRTTATHLNRYRVYVCIW
jgi:hypothetical protein